MKDVQKLLVKAGFSADLVADVVTKSGKAGLKLVEDGGIMYITSPGKRHPDSLPPSTHLLNTYTAHIRSLFPPAKPEIALNMSQIREKLVKKFSFLDVGTFPVSDLIKRALPSNEFCFFSSKTSPRTPETATMNMSQLPSATGKKKGPVVWVGRVFPEGTAPVPDKPATSNDEADAVDAQSLGRDWTGTEAQKE